MADRETEDRRRANESRRTLERVQRESETLGTSSIARTANRTRDHFLGDDQDPEDRVEVVGTRIGRILGLIAFIALAIHITYKYILPA